MKPKTLETVYYISKGNIQEYYVLGDYLVPVGTWVFKESEFKNKIKCKNKKDSIYMKLIYKLSNGSSIIKYKGSKYYDYYMDRLQKENPEFLI